MGENFHQKSIISFATIIHKHLPLHKKTPPKRRRKYKKQTQ